MRLVIFWPGFFCFSTFLLLTIAFCIILPLPLSVSEIAAIRLIQSFLSRPFHPFQASQLLSGFCAAKTLNLRSCGNCKSLSRNRGKLSVEIAVSELSRAPSSIPSQEQRAVKGKRESSELELLPPLCFKPLWLRSAKRVHRLQKQGLLSQFATITLIADCVGFTRVDVNLRQVVLQRATTKIVEG